MSAAANQRTPFDDEASVPLFSNSFTSWQHIKKAATGDPQKSVRTYTMRLIKLR